MASTQRTTSSARPPVNTSAPSRRAWATSATAAPPRRTGTLGRPGAERRPLGAPLWVILLLCTRCLRPGGLARPPPSPRELPRGCPLRARRRRIPSNAAGWPQWRQAMRAARRVRRRGPPFPACDPGGEAGAESAHEPRGDGARAVLIRDRELALLPKRSYRVQRGSDELQEHFVRFHARSEGLFEDVPRPGLVTRDKSRLEAGARRALPVARGPCLDRSTCARSAGSTCHAPLTRLAGSLPVRT